MEETADRNISKYAEPDASDQSEVDEPPERKKPRAKQRTLGWPKLENPIFLAAASCQ